ncbi:MAG: hypothetical protein ACE5FA_05120 [Dehalococcoidia bacterium]
MKTVANPAVVAVVGAGLLVVACQIAPVVHLINMSGRDVSVVVLDDEIAIAPREDIAFAYPYSANGGMSIRYGRCVLAYMPPAPPKNGYTRYSGIREHFNVRLEPDGSVVMLPPTEGELTAAPLQEQPEGFPLVPTKSGECD